MFKADIILCERKSFYDINGYEKVYNIIGKFKEFSNTTIHSIGENDKKLLFDLKGDYYINFNLNGDKCSIELNSSGREIDDFRDKYNKLVKIVGEEFK